MANVLTDGFPTIFGFGESPDDSGELADTIFGVVACEKRVKPFGIDGGGPNDTTCMRNTKWRTRQAKRLITLTDLTLTVSYNPSMFDGDGDFFARLLENQEMFVGWPDASLVTFWGFVDSFDPHEITEGAQPEADIKVCPSNQNNDGEEVGPVYTADGWEPQNFFGNPNAA